jgi:Zn-finger nucleic acid-binding protein
MLTLHRFNVEIDYCPTSKGVWLDRGELDKVIEFMDTKKGRKKAREGSLLPAAHPDDVSGNYRYEDDYFQHKMKSFLNELFKF